MSSNMEGVNKSEAREETSARRETEVSEQSSLTSMDGNQTNDQTRRGIARRQIGILEKPGIAPQPSPIRSAVKDCHFEKNLSAQSLLESSSAKSLSGDDINSRDNDKAVNKSGKKKASKSKAQSLKKTATNGDGASKKKSGVKNTKERSRAVKSSDGASKGDKVMEDGGIKTKDDVNSGDSCNSSLSDTDSETDNTIIEGMNRTEKKDTKSANGTDAVDKNVTSDDRSNDGVDNGGQGEVNIADPAEKDGEDECKEAENLCGDGEQEGGITTKTLPEGETADIIDAANNNEIKPDSSDDNLSVDDNEVNVTKDDGTDGVKEAVIRSEVDSGVGSTEPPNENKSKECLDGDEERDGQSDNQNDSEGEEENEEEVLIAGDVAGDDKDNGASNSDSQIKGTATAHKSNAKHTKPKEEKKKGNNKEKSAKEKLIKKASTGSKSSQGKSGGSETSASSKELKNFMKKTPYFVRTDAPSASSRAKESTKSSTKRQEKKNDTQGPKDSNQERSSESKTHKESKNTKPPLRAGRSVKPVSSKSSLGNPDEKDAKSPKEEMVIQLPKEGKTDGEPDGEADSVSEKTSTRDDKVNHGDSKSSSQVDQASELKPLDGSRASSLPASGPKPSEEKPQLDGSSKEDAKKADNNNSTKKGVTRVSSQQMSDTKDSLEEKSSISRAPSIASSLRTEALSMGRIQSRPGSSVNRTKNNNLFSGNGPGSAKGPRSKSREDTQREHPKFTLGPELDTESNRSQENPDSQRDSSPGRSSTMKTSSSNKNLNDLSAKATIVKSESKIKKSEERQSSSSRLDKTNVKEPPQSAKGNKNKDVEKPLVSEAPPTLETSRILQLAQRAEWSVLDQVLRATDKVTPDLIQGDPVSIKSLSANFIWFLADETSSYVIHFQDYGITPLMIAVRENRLVIVEKMLDIGANVNDKCKVCPKSV